MQTRTSGMAVVMIVLGSLAAPYGSWSQTKPALPSSLAASAQELENQQRWLEAAQLYVELLAIEPEQSVWQEALRRCLLQERIRQRYRDPTVRQLVRNWKLTQALAAYEEFVRLVEQVFVDNVAADHLWRRGCEQLMWALANWAYSELAFTANPTAAQLDKLRSMLDMESRHPPLDPGELSSHLRLLAQRAALYAPIRPTAVVWEFLAASCESVDAYGAYVTPTGLVLEKMLSEDKWAGVGLSVSAGESGALITAVVPESEAQRLGVVPGSRLIRINGELTRSLSTEEIMLRLLGQPDSSVELEIVYPEGTQKTVSLTRKHVTLATVTEATLLDSMMGIGYVRVAQFQRHTVLELDRVLQELKQRGLRVLILDLRGNPGGSVRAALELADRFIPEGVLVRTHGRLPELNAEYSARREDDWHLPVIVLVDENTASAAEMAVGAIQAHAHTGRITAAVVGRPTRGKGVLQHLVPLAEGQAGAACLTVARWLTPAGTSISPQGIQPDVLVKPLTPLAHESMMDLDMMPMSNMETSVESVAWQAALRKAIQLCCEQP
ncbi:MAG: S41 family peptidase [Gemmatales bacterium]|nr:S41 family peptidase [Gemmatales bacterium]MDW8175730.1 S41 family peptidase [Gemmatales bacterium]